MVRIRCYAQSIEVPDGTTVAAALLTGGAVFTPLCGMGICMQCRVTINRKPNQLACQTICTKDMEIETR
ncbi:MAG: (2Fe-2S)-binding protein [Acidobacteria bacterium]|nr:(2Fe-2S)-binding protein [Acidobacteriota bacterium]